MNCARQHIVIRWCVLASLTAASTAAWAGPCDPAGDQLVSGSAIVRPVGSVQAVLDELNTHPDLPGVTFTVDDDSLAARGIYLLAFEPLSASHDVEGVLGFGGPTSLTSITWGEALYENHDPEGNTGTLWFHSIEGSLRYHDQYTQTMLGLPSAQSRTTGAGALVAVLDTGIDDTHPALAGQIAPGGFNYITATADTSDDGVGGSVGHGTYVAGLIHLVAPDAMLMPVVVLDGDGTGDAWALVRGLYHAIDAGADVINLSLGSTYDAQAVEDAVEEAEDLGIIVVSAGGNCDAGEEREEFPASKTAGIGVAAVDDLDVKADFSNYNGKFSISAPGTSEPDPGEIDGFDPLRSIYSTLPGGDYGIWEGTSFSTAFVSGTAALFAAQHPEWPAIATADRIALVLEQTAVDLYGIPANAPYADDESLGIGRLHTGDALALTAGDLDLDGTVGTADFLMLLGLWGPCGPDCLADLDLDGFVGVTDFLLLLGNWG